MPLPSRLSSPGPILTYLLHIREVSTDGAEKWNETISAVRAALTSPEGIILLDLLEKATTGYFLPPSADQCALNALNAQRFIALDLRRVLSNEPERVFKPSENDAASARTAVARRRRPST